ncbi:MULTISPECIES: bacteriochlorophyll 4-vinyl reductase [Thiorhodovibrio]|uniref:bacteriochlorophyll 4-vinyl reductase n=1 Tax=Thiorhodovibrio TaxID=61593 RepID=UPI002B25BF87|nr:bacteriochlorophyll 4-vinyl reductase [Thiorhodovibrio litoralis]
MEHEQGQEADAAEVARIGPNAIIRVGEALTALEENTLAGLGLNPRESSSKLSGAGSDRSEGSALASCGTTPGFELTGIGAKIFADAGLEHYLNHPPSEMVPESEVIALQQALRAALPQEIASAVSRDAGRRTGDYLLAHRIPKPAQRLLKLLPPGPACRMLLKAVANNAWTFVGSGQYAFTMGRPVRVSIAQCPICRGATATVPVCDFYAGSFERLCQILVSPRARVHETQCQALGAAACEFQIDWGR